METIPGDNPAWAPPANQMVEGRTLQLIVQNLESLLVKYFLVLSAVIPKFYQCIFLLTHRYTGPQLTTLERCGHQKNT